MEQESKIGLRSRDGWTAVKTAEEVTYKVRENEMAQVVIVVDGE